MVDVALLDLVVIAAIFVATTSVAAVYTARYLRRSKPVENPRHEVRTRIVVREAISKEDVENPAIGVHLLGSRAEIERIKQEVDGLLREVEGDD